MGEPQPRRLRPHRQPPPRQPEGCAVQPPVVTSVQGSAWPRGVRAIPPEQWAGHTTTTHLTWVSLLPLGQCSEVALVAAEVLSLRLKARPWRRRAGVSHGHRRARTFWHCCTARYRHGHHGQRVPMSHSGILTGLIMACREDPSVDQGVCGWPMAKQRLLDSQAVWRADHSERDAQALGQRKDGSAVSLPRRAWECVCACEREGTHIVPIGGQTTEVHLPGHPLCLDSTTKGPQGLSWWMAHQPPQGDARASGMALSHLQTGRASRGWLAGTPPFAVAVCWHRPRPAGPPTGTGSHRRHCSALLAGSAGPARPAGQTAPPWEAESPERAQTRLNIAGTPQLHLKSGWCDFQRQGCAPTGKTKPTSPIDLAPNPLPPHPCPTSSHPSGPQSGHTWTVERRSVAVSHRVENSG